MAWISVNERLPELKRVDDCSSQSKEVVVAIGDEILIASLHSGDEDGGWEVWYCRAYSDSIENVDHWLELPKKPNV